MSEQSDATLLLLRLVAELTEQAGRSPSIAEVAAAMGLSTSNLLTQIQPFHSVYLTWDRQEPQTLGLTDEAKLLLEQQAASAKSVAPIPTSILRLLASGLTYLCMELANGKPLHVPYPEPWQRGQNRLAAEFFRRGVLPPASTVELAHWCSRPLRTWPLPFELPDLLLDSPLLQEGEPTSLCRELAYGLPHAGDAEFEISQAIMVDILRHARARQEQRSYVALRRYLIENPIVTREDLLSQSFNSEMGGLAKNLKEFYEEVPSTIIEAAQVRLCGHCGWTLERGRDGRLRCGADRCRVLTHDFTQGTIQWDISADSFLLRVRRPFRRYIVAPGQYEVRTATLLEKLGVQVELWPDFDAFDLLITFPDGESWAVDVKDWRYPHLLARHLAPLRRDEDLTWSRSFYVVPDQRHQENPAYLAVLRAHNADRLFDIVTIGELLQEVRSHLGE